MCIIGIEILDPAGPLVLVKLKYEVPPTASLNLFQNLNVWLKAEACSISPFIHTLRFGNKFRDAVGGTSYLSFTNTRGSAGCKISIPMMHKIDSGLRPYYLTHEFTIHDAPCNDEIVIAIGGASSGRAHARTGDRYQDMKEMGLKNPK